jgi:hypothetical protein
MIVIAERLSLVTWIDPRATSMMMMVSMKVDLKYIFTVSSASLVYVGTSLMQDDIHCIALSALNEPFIIISFGTKSFGT